MRSRNRGRYGNPVPGAAPLEPKDVTDKRKRRKPITLPRISIQLDAPDEPQKKDSQNARD